MVTAAIKKDLQIMTDLTKASGRQNLRIVKYYKYMYSDGKYKK